MRDFDLLDRWQAGDKAAGNRLFHRHFDAVHRFFDRRVEEPDELAQATFLACLEARDQFRRQSSFRTYLFGIARYTWYAHLRRQARAGQDVDFEEVSIAALSTSVGTRIGRGEDMQRLQAALRLLPVAQQSLLELHYWEEMSADELAEVFEIAPTTARTRLFRAREALREILENMEGVPELTSTDNLEAWVRRVRERAGPPDEE